MKICTDCYHAEHGDVTGNSDDWNREAWERNVAGQIVNVEGDPYFVYGGSHSDMCDLCESTLGGDRYDAEISAR